MKILINGGCGFLGSNLAEYALDNNIELVIFDNLSRLGSANNLSWLKNKGKFKFIHGDIRNTNDVEVLIREQKPNAIFHVAGQVAMTTSIDNPRKDFEVNAIGTLNVLEAIRKYSPNTSMFFSSTNKVYGDLNQYNYDDIGTRYVCREFPRGYSEKINLEFRSPYGCSKGTADQYMLDYAKVYGLKTVVFRHSSMYGGRQYATYDQGWVGWFCKQAIDIKRGILKKPFYISGNGKQVRDVLHADDMINLYYSALNNIDDIHGQVFNIGGGYENSLSLIELFKILEQKLDIKMRYEELPWRESDQKVFIADITKAKDFIKWNPNVNKEKGIDKMLEWVSSL